MKVVVSASQPASPQQFSLKSSMNGKSDQTIKHSQNSGTDSKHPGDIKKTFQKYVAGNTADFDSGSSRDRESLTTSTRAAMFSQSTVNLRKMMYEEKMNGNDKNTRGRKSIASARESSVGPRGTYGRVSRAAAFIDGNGNPTPTHHRARGSSLGGHLVAEQSNYNSSIAFRQGKTNKHRDRAEKLAARLLKDTRHKDIKQIERTIRKLREIHSLQFAFLENGTNALHIAFKECTPVSQDPEAAEPTAPDCDSFIKLNPTIEAIVTPILAECGYEDLLRYASEVYDHEKRWTVLHYIAEKGEEAGLYYLARAIVRIYKLPTDRYSGLPMHFLTPDVRDDKGRTPLHIAAINGRDRLCLQLVLLVTSSSDIKDGKNRTPLWYARKYNHPQCAQLLVDSGAETSKIYERGASEKIEVKVVNGTYPKDGEDKNNHNGNGLHSSSSGSYSISELSRKTDTNGTDEASHEKANGKTKIKVKTEVDVEDKEKDKEEDKNKSDGSTTNRSASEEDEDEEKHGSTTKPAEGFLEGRNNHTLEEQLREANKRTLEDPFGWKWKEEEQEKMNLTEEVPAKHRAKWVRCLNDKEFWHPNIMKTNHFKWKKICKLARKGIPNDLRAEAWAKMVHVRTTEVNKEGITRGLSEEEHYNAMVNNLKRNGTYFTKQIDMDIERTAREHSLFIQRYGQKQRELFQLLRIYAVHNPDVGYCQGMNNIGSLLLMYYNDEQQAFSLFNKVMVYYRMTERFRNGFPLLQKDFKVFTNLVKIFLPDIHSLFAGLGVDISMISFKWFIMIFCTTLPFVPLLRTFDYVLCEGDEAMHCVGLGILKMFHERIVNSSFDEVLLFLQHLEDLNQNELDADVLISTAVQYRREIKKKKINFAEMYERAEAEIKEAKPRV
eukprot:TRINITY_DN25575_c0_g1_i1.p1 TRINITY_DN25575_c0_g1~~TRINITY_DN25575_c0_g1_i1.p1  ORF type:complete len:890 (-),score=210.37 TRINITY_DN25575_c0_g1_i1:148-2817(-)